MTTHTWTPEQQAFIEASTANHLEGRALAGTGKTATLEARIRQQHIGGIYLCLNKRNAQEATTRLTGTPIRPSTLHSFCYAAWRNASGIPKCTVASSKVWKLTNAYPFEQRADIKTLVALAKSNGLIPAALQARTSAEASMPDSRSAWTALADVRDIILDDDLLEAARATLTRSIDQSFEGLIDFDDMIYMPTLFGGRFRKEPNILLDEAQDFSQLDHIAISRSIGLSSTLTFIGDPHQAIYAFRGASDTSMDQLTARYAPTTLPLTTNFRCSRDVIREAQRIVPAIRAQAAAPLGSVTVPPEWTPESIPPGSAILCRNNAPLFRVAWQLLAAAIPTLILGRDIGAGLITLIDKATKGENLTRQKFLGRLSAYAAAAIEASPARRARLEDRVAAITAIAQGCADTAGLKRTIQQLFDEARPKVTLSTIHKSKGLEWSNVYFLDEHLIRDGEGQESNLRYVAITRSREHLAYIYSPEGGSKGAGR